jgi:hypothetical protein
VSFEERTLIAADKVVQQVTFDPIEDTSGHSRWQEELIIKINTATIATCGEEKRAVDIEEIGQKKSAVVKFKKEEARNLGGSFQDYSGNTVTASAKPKAASRPMLRGGSAGEPICAICMSSPALTQEASETGVGIAQA